MNSKLLAAGLVTIALPALAETPVLTVLTYASFTSEWGPGPAIEKAFEADCGCDLKFVPAGDGAALLARARTHPSQRFGLDLADVAEVWRRGSVILSWLIDLTAIALAAGPKLDSFTNFVEDSGEGRWTINAAIKEAVPATVLSAALYARFRSRQEHSFADKMLSAMRKGFGGHQKPEKS